jgi:sugar lactone lactonase YvrE
LYVPAGVAADANGKVYVADTFNNRVRKIDSAGVITTLAGTGTPFPVSGDGGPAANARLAWPTGLRLDAAGNLYIADAGNMRVRRVSRDGIITTVAGSGPGGPGYGGDGGAATDAQLTNPTGLALDRAGNLFIGDGASVRRISLEGIITTVAGNGMVGLTGDGGPATSAETGAWGWRSIARAGFTEP